VPSVRLFVGNLPYQATEEDLRSHFGQVGPLTQVVRPLDRETGRARGFAFVEFGDRALAEAAIKRFDGQLFMGRPLAVSEARAREDRGPGGPRPGGGFSGPRPPGAGYGGPRPGGGAPGYGPPRYGGSSEGTGGSAAARDRNFGPPAPPKGSKKGAKAGSKKDENRPRGPIPTKFTGRMYDLDEVNEEDTTDDVTPDFMKHDAEEDVPDEGKEEKE
jgi:RNA recognition motif-containing protein